MICAIAGMKKMTLEERKMRMQFSSKREQSADSMKTEIVSKQVEKKNVIFFITRTTNFHYTHIHGLLRKRCK